MDDQSLKAFVVTKITEIFSKEIQSTESERLKLPIGVSFKDGCSLEQEMCALPSAFSAQGTETGMQSLVRK